jgi:hypothetical protein
MVVHALGPASCSGVLEQAHRRPRALSVFESRVAQAVERINLVLEVVGGTAVADSVMANGLSLGAFDVLPWPLQPGENLIQVLIMQPRARAPIEPQMFAILITREQRADPAAAPPLGGSAAAAGADDAAWGGAGSRQGVHRYVSRPSLGGTAYEDGAPWGMPTHQPGCTSASTAATLATLLTLLAAACCVLSRCGAMRQWAASKLHMLGRATALPPDGARRRARRRPLWRRRRVAQADPTTARTR